MDKSRGEFTRQIGAGLATAGSIAVAAWKIWVAVTAHHNTSGVGNEFDIRARVVSVGEQSVTVDNVTLESAHGKAENWFKSGSHQVHNNYSEGSLCTTHTVGHEKNAEGVDIPLNSIQVGDELDIVGAIRDSRKAMCGKGYDTRPVFTQLTDLNR